MGMIGGQRLHRAAQIVTILSTGATHCPFSIIMLSAGRMECKIKYLRRTRPITRSTWTRTWASCLPSSTCACELRSTIHVGPTPYIVGRLHHFGSQDTSTLTNMEPPVREDDITRNEFLQDPRFLGDVGVRCSTHICKADKANRSLGCDCKQHLHSIVLLVQRECPNCPQLARWGLNVNFEAVNVGCEGLLEDIFEALWNVLLQDVSFWPNN